MATILITGANRGIGLELARRYAERGDTVIATARQPARAEELSALSASSAHVEVVALDVCDPTSIASLAKSLSGRSVDILINNAGMLTSRGGIEDASHDLKSWTDTLLTNVAGPFLVTQAVLPALARAKDAKIAIIASHLGSNVLARGFSYPYCASKAGAINLASNLAVELKPRGIAVGAFHPGWVQTEMGGANAETTVPDSANGLVARIDHLTLATSGVFENYRGETLPF